MDSPCLGHATISGPARIDEQRNRDAATCWPRVDIEAIVRGATHFARSVDRLDARRQIERVATQLSNGQCSSRAESLELK